MYSIYKRDYDFGIQNENSILPIIEKHFNDNIKKTKGKYNRFDFEGDSYMYELKSRTNTYSKYPTTLITTKKLNSEKKLILLFKFTDNLYYIEYDELLFKNFERAQFRRTDRRDPLAEHIYIPISLLKLID
jgi:hypothetical protein